MIDVTVVSRSPAAGRHFSIERVVDDVFADMPPDLRVQRLVVPRRGVHPLAMLANCRSVRAIRSDVVHVTGDVHYVLPFVRRRSRRVLTVHDLASLHRSSGLRRRLIRWWWYTLPFHAADAITAVSDETVADIRRLFPRLRTPLLAIENPVSDCFQPTQTGRHAGRRVLAMGTGDNKNLLRLIEAVDGLNVHLRIVGELSSEQAASLRHHDVDHSTAASLSDSELSSEYAAADVLAFVSLSEGFGLPIIEAQACALPVITSNHAPMNRVSGGAAVLVDATDVGAIRAAIGDVLGDAQLRSELVAAGLRNVVERRPTVVAQRYAQVLRGDS